MNIGEKIKKLRQEKNVSQAVLGEIVGVHEKHISRYERGISQPSAEILRKMAGFFGVSIDFLSMKVVLALKIRKIMNSWIISRKQIG